MVNDPLSDLVARIKNGYRAGAREVRLPWSRIKEDVARVLTEQKLVERHEKKENELVIGLRYDGKTPALTDIRRVSKPGTDLFGVKNYPGFGGLGIIFCLHLPALWRISKLKSYMWGRNYRSSLVKICQE